MKTYLYLIPARGGSKGIPGKNIKILGDKPLICYSIDAALEVADQTDVIVSTDSADIAEVAEKAGASIPFIRPAEFATDSSSSRSVILHALDFMAEHGKHYDAVVLLQPTSPLRTPDDIRNCIRAFEESQKEEDSEKRADMAVTVIPARTNPYYNAFETDQSGFLHISKGEGNFTRRQDAPKVWEFNGAVYVIDADAIRHSEISKMRHIVPVEMAEERSIDLDTPADWRNAELALGKLNERI